LGLSLLSATTLPKLANLASKSLLFSQILGSARDSSPAFGGAGKRAGAFCAVSVQCAKAALTFVASKGSSPRTMRLIAPRFCPFPFIKDLRWERGSDWATTAVTPAATATTARTVRIISLAPSVDRSPTRTLLAWPAPCKPRNGQDIPAPAKQRAVRLGSTRE